MSTRQVRAFGIALVTMMLVVFAWRAPSEAVTTAPGENTAARIESDGNQDCEKARERCIESCLNFRKACDKNHPDDAQYCIEQQNVCDAGCNDAWKTCSETKPPRR